MLMANDIALINLVRHLTPDQIDSLANDNLTVTGQSGMQYRIYIDRSAQVEELSGSKRKFCLQFPKDDLPTYDRILAKVLLLQSDEKLFLETANRVVEYGERVIRIGVDYSNEYLDRMARESRFLGLHPESDDPCPPDMSRWNGTPIVWRHLGVRVIPEQIRDQLPVIAGRADPETGLYLLSATYTSGFADETLAKHHISTYMHMEPERLRYMEADISHDHVSYRFYVTDQAVAHPGAFLERFTMPPVPLEEGRLEGWEP